MRFRYARHTNNLDALTHFYHKIIGLHILGSFDNHDGYDGVFLGFPKLDWHLEFTQTNEDVVHVTDADDLMVLYFDDDNQIQNILSNAEKINIKPVHSKNPYWNKKGIELTDPDGFGIILTTWQFDS